MEIKLTFCGAAGNVTGSRYLVEALGHRLYVDCGIFQEWKLKERNWRDGPVPASEIDAVVLTHGHLDHCGLVPRLVKNGFQGPVYCTKATAEIASIVMLDSGRIQEEDAKHKAKRHAREGRKGKGPGQPLYTALDAEAAITHLKPKGFDTAVEILEGIEVTFFSAGHILGAASVALRIHQGGEERTVVFSGDVGPWEMPILRDPAPPVKADYVVVESTYGDRDHPKRVPVQEQLAEVVAQAVEAGGVLLIPSFSVERAQDLLYHLSGLLAEGRIPRLHVFLDSPMAIRVTEVFRHNPDLFDEEALAVIERGEHPCDFPGLVMSRSREDSKAINQREGTSVIIAGSGMCTGGRVKHHLLHYMGKASTTILFVGYQASGTLGRQILDGRKEVRLFGKPRPVRAQVAYIGGFSAHADRSGLMRWLSSFETPPRQVFVTHGEASAADAFAEQIREERGYSVQRPSYLDTVVLD